MPLCAACCHDLQALTEQLHGLQVIEAEVVASQLELRQRIDATLDAALTDAAAAAART